MFATLATESIFQTTARDLRALRGEIYLYTLEIFISRRPGVIISTREEIPTDRRRGSERPRSDKNTSSYAGNFSARSQVRKVHVHAESPRTAASLQLAKSSINR